jgi:nitrite reductase/ring-hydroxylating ferredoxin subunit
MTECFIDAAALVRIPAGAQVRVVVGDYEVAIFNGNGHFYALADACLRCGKSLGAGSLCGYTEVCWECGWRYDVRSGSVEGVPRLRIETFTVKVVNARVLVSTFPVNLQAEPED